MKKFVEGQKYVVLGVKEPVPILCLKVDDKCAFLKNLRTETCYVGYNPDLYGPYVEPVSMTAYLIKNIDTDTVFMTHRPGYYQSRQYRLLGSAVVTEGKFDT